MYNLVEYYAAITKKDLVFKKILNKTSNTKLTANIIVVFFKRFNET